MSPWVACVVASLGAAVLAGCAVGAEGGPDGTDDAVDASAGDAPARRLDAGTTPRVDANLPPAVDSSMLGDDGGGAPSPDAGGGGGTDGGGSGGTSCDSPDTCGSAATSLGSIAGDESGSPASGTGTTSDWLLLDVTEQNDGPLAAPMLLTVTLTSPPGENFDLYVYLAGDPSSIECSMVAGSSTQGAGQTDSVSLEWGETGTFANGSDDSAHVTLEVRSASGNTCSAATWSVSAVGDE